MKKILTSFILVLSVLVLSLVFTQNIYATDEKLLTITGYGSFNTIHLSGEDGEFYIYLDGQKYGGGYNTGRIADFIDDYADSFTNPALGYAVEIKGVYNQSCMITGYGVVNTIHLSGEDGEFYIYLDGQKYGGGYNTGRIADFIDDYADSFTNPALGY